MGSIKKEIKCYDCREAVATVTIRSLISPKKSERRVCKECAAKRNNWRIVK